MGVIEQIKDIHPLAAPGKFHGMDGKTNKILCYICN